MLEAFPLAPPDSILGLGEAFEKDPRTNKINLTVGVFKDEQGRTPILQSVHRAEAKLLEAEKTKSYLPIEGSPDFNRRVVELVLGKNFDTARVAAAHTPGGTGALRVGADTIARQFPHSRVWLSNPTWANHGAIFKAAGLEPLSYSYLNASKTGLDFDAMIGDLEKQGRPGDLVCLHACCHNPTGIDPTLPQWESIAACLARKGMLPFVDFAYQGFGDGLEEDARPLQVLLAHLPEAIVCASFSKNFGLYSERVGALIMIGSSAQGTNAMMSQLRLSVRANYSNPPRHGESVVATILGDPDLYKLWRSEVDAMRNRISQMRQAFIEGMGRLGHDFQFLASQKGMFSYTGLNAMQADWLKSEKGVYIVGTGRINVAGLSPQTMDAVCSAVHEACSPR